MWPVKVAGTAAAFLPCRAAPDSSILIASGLRITPKWLVAEARRDVAVIFSLPVAVTSDCVRSSASVSVVSSRMIWTSVDAGMRVEEVQPEETVRTS